MNVCDREILEIKPLLYAGPCNAPQKSGGFSRSERARAIRFRAISCHSHDSTAWLRRRGTARLVAAGMVLSRSGRSNGLDEMQEID